MAVVRAGVLSVTGARPRVLLEGEDVNQRGFVFKAVFQYNFTLEQMPRNNSPVPLWCPQKQGMYLRRLSQCISPLCSLSSGAGGMQEFSHFLLDATCHFPKFIIVASHCFLFSELVKSISLQGFPRPPERRPGCNTGCLRSLLLPAAVSETQRAETARWRQLTRSREPQNWRLERYYFCMFCSPPPLVCVGSCWRMELI